MGSGCSPPLFLVLILVETTDILFAVDSIPAILAVSRDPFVVYASNVFAILGLRSLYMAVAGMMDIFHYLNYGLSAILVLVGAKLLFSNVYKAPVEYTLGSIALILALSIGGLGDLAGQNVHGCPPHGAVLISADAPLVSPSAQAVARMGVTFSSAPPVWRGIRAHWRPRNPPMTELAKAYEPKAVEAKWLEIWNDGGYFQAEVDETRKPYCLTIPPPNVTGELHLGHGLQHSIHDTLIRWKRMSGFNALCVPGTDHASISTTIKVRDSLRAQGIDPAAIGREKFLEHAWAWKETYGGKIINQLKALGCSYDWRRERFTMDDGYYKAVTTSFVRLYQEGYIYRGKRVVNWCVTDRTTLSDLEVEHADEASSLWHLRYPLSDGSGSVVVATTRPETMLGDTAVAVNSRDPRWNALIGKTVRLPLMERDIPVIADDILVDPAFGTGVVKVTPAHDPNDFQSGMRNNLPQVVVIGLDGHMTEEAGQYAGLDRFEARQRIVKDLEALGLLVDVQEYTHSVGHCARCQTIIEPLPLDQWWCREKDLALRTLNVVREGEVQYFPDRFAGMTEQWIENLRDWNISRQLWWGHRIPAWFCQECGEVTVQMEGPNACPKCGGAVQQDSDTLDTWFSSALWPMAVLGWPDDTPELKYFYPDQPDDHGARHPVPLDRPYGVDERTLPSTRSRTTTCTCTPPSRPPTVAA